MLSTVLGMQSRLLFSRFWFPSMMIEVAGGLNSILTVLLSKSCLIEHIGCKFFRFRKCLNSSNVLFCWVCRCGMIVKVSQLTSGNPESFYFLLDLSLSNNLNWSTYPKKKLEKKMKNLLIWPNFPCQRGICGHRYI